jgi:glycosyltransferase involved in cell wall biosynthesis
MVYQKYKVQQQHMKIAINSRIYTSVKTGIQRYIEGLHKELIKKCPDVDFVFFQTDRTKVLGRTRVIPSFLGIFGITLFDFFLVLFLLIKEKPDIFHGPSHVLPIIRVPGVKYVLTIHDCAPFTVPQAYSFLYRLYFKITLWFSVRTAHLIYAVSESTKRDVVRIFGVDPSRIHVVYCGFDSLPLGSVSKYKMLAEQEQPFLMAAVTHFKRKNILGALEAFSYLKSTSDRHKDLNFVCVGSLSKKNKKLLTEKAKDLGIIENCRFLGYVSDEHLENLYSECVAIVYPSLYEGFGLPPLEAMCAGAIPIVSDNSSLPEVVPFDELRFDPQDKISIVNCMDFVLSLGKESRLEYISLLKKHAETFTWERSAKLFLRALQE